VHKIYSKKANAFNFKLHPILIEITQGLLVSRTNLMAGKQEISWKWNTQPAMQHLSYYFSDSALSVGTTNKKRERRGEMNYTFKSSSATSRMANEFRRRKILMKRSHTLDQHS